MSRVILVLTLNERNDLLRALGELSHLNAALNRSLCNSGVCIHIWKIPTEEEERKGGRIREVTNLSFLEYLPIHYPIH